MHPVLAGAFAVAAVVASQWASAASTFCPETIKVQQSATAPAAEWSVSYSKAPVKLEMVSLYSGPPKEGVALGYDALVNTMAESTLSWLLPKNSRAYWIKCSYRGTTLELAKELPRTLTSCLVSYAPESGPGSRQPQIKAVACK
jgi:hypothetical protein